MASATILPVEALAPAFRGIVGYNRWTLCLGAGASYGILPKWDELTLGVVNKVFGLKCSQSEFNDLVRQTGWALDSWIQAAANRYQFQGHTREEFHSVLQGELYSGLFAKAQAINVYAELLEALKWPRNLPRGAVRRLCGFFETEYANTTLIGLVRWMTDASRKNKRPYAIISFNVDTLFHTVFELFQRRAHYALPLRIHSHPKYIFTRVATPHPISRDADFTKTCIYHCHGILMPWLSAPAPRPPWNTDNIVFLEQDYLKVSSRAATWPETLFMYHAKISQLLFVGFSMSDQNVRRWLGLSEEFSASIRKAGSERRVHYWITRKRAPVFEPLFLEGLAHLGVRPAWIADWSELEAAVRNLTAV